MSLIFNNDPIVDELSGLLGKLFKGELIEFRPSTRKTDAAPGFRIDFNGCDIDCFISSIMYDDLLMSTFPNTRRPFTHDEAIRELTCAIAYHIELYKQKQIDL